MHWTAPSGSIATQSVNVPPVSIQSCQRRGTSDSARKRLAGLRRPPAVGPGDRSAGRRRLQPLGAAKQLLGRPPRAPAEQQLTQRGSRRRFVGAESPRPVVVALRLVEAAVAQAQVAQGDVRERVAVARRRGQPEQLLRLAGAAVHPQQHRQVGERRTAPRVDLERPPVARLGRLDASAPPLRNAQVDPGGGEFGIDPDRVPEPGHRLLQLSRAERLGAAVRIEERRGRQVADPIHAPAFILLTHPKSMTRIVCLGPNPTAT